MGGIFLWSVKMSSPNPQDPGQEIYNILYCPHKTECQCREFGKNEQEEFCKSCGIAEVELFEGDGFYCESCCYDMKGAIGE